MGDTEPENKAGFQKLLDNPWILLVLGIVVPTLSYTVWGWIEIMTIPAAKLP